jgi:hypothetical protein
VRSVVVAVAVIDVVVVVVVAAGRADPAVPPFEGRRPLLPAASMTRLRAKQGS